MRFMIVTPQRISPSPYDGPTGMMQVLDLIEAPSAEDAIEVFMEDNIQYADSGFSEFLCIGLSEDSFVGFSLRSRDD